MTTAHDCFPNNLDQHNLSDFCWKSSTVLAFPLAQSFGTHLPQRAPYSSVQTPTFSQMLSLEYPSASTALEFLTRVATRLLKQQQLMIA